MILKGGFKTPGIFNFWRRGWFFLLALALVACIPSRLNLPQSPLFHSLERKSGLIVYVGQDGNIYTLDQEGKHQTTLSGEVTAPEALVGRELFFQFPAWSPDGRKVAFVGFVSSGPIIEEVTLYTVSRNGQDLVEIWKSSEQFPFYLYWSPDGKRLSFLATAPGASQATLQIVPAGGGEAQVLGTGAPIYWDWSPDNHTLLIHSDKSSASEDEPLLAFLNIRAEGKEPVEKKLDVRPARFQAPAYSPDGDELLLAGETGQAGNEGLLLLDKEGHIKKVLASIEGPVAFGWSPDGEWVAYVNGRDANSPDAPRSLVVLDPQDPEGTRTSIDEVVVAFFWSPNSQRIAYFVPSQGTNTASPDSNGSSPTGPELYLNLHILDVRSKKSLLVASFQPTEDFVNFLFYFDQYQRSATIWSPDSRNLVVSARRDQGKSGIFIVEASGNLESRYLTNGILALWSGH
ncbi:MAG: hypothetical protein A2Z16_12925 [Chloroflexi bacterium RBG_16_54_18]|nr:MAG: hypothetical protein A2Z16_12925 [Chloroflexi bacterium RBG_16_54_18]